MMKLRTLTCVAALLVASCGDAQEKQDDKELKSGVYLENMDRTVRPQDDFYQFVNGGWLDNTPIPPIYSRYTVYAEVNEVVQDQMKVLIDEAVNGTHEQGTEAQMVADVYKAFMNESAIEAAGIDAIKLELDMVRGIETRADLIDVLIEFENLGVSKPFSVSVGADTKNSSMNIGYVGQGGLTLPSRDYYIDLENKNFDKVRDGYQPYIEDMLAFVGEGDTGPMAEAIYGFETKLAEAQWSRLQNRDPNKRYNPTFRAEYGSVMGDEVNWDDILTRMGVASDNHLSVSQPSYFKALSKLMAEESLDTWKAYLLFKVVHGRANHLHKAVRDRQFEFTGRLMRGQKEQQPRWKQALGQLNGSLGFAVGKMYVAKHFPPEAKAKMDEMVTNVINTFDESLDTLEWMSPETRAQAKKKLSTFKPKIGYPDIWKDYSSIKVSAASHMDNVRSVTAWANAEDLRELNQPVDRSEWFMTPQMVNAYYSPSRNEIGFPAARLQPPFFQLDADLAISYGAVGGVIGHEISHGFDDNGSQYDGEGNLKNWWTEEDRAEFEKRAFKFADQYSEFEPVEGMKLNGRQVLGEALGDLNGVQMAYRAYIKSLGGKEAPVLDGFTGPQRFFIGYAMSRKGKRTEASQIAALPNAVHPPLRYRVMGVYPNIDAFYEAWNVQPGDGMYLPPEDRVSIW